MQATSQRRNNDPAVIIILCNSTMRRHISLQGTCCSVLLCRFTIPALPQIFNKSVLQVMVFRNTVDCLDPCLGRPVKQHFNRVGCSIEVLADRVDYFTVSSKIRFRGARLMRLVVVFVWLFSELRIGYSNTLPRCTTYSTLSSSPVLRFELSRPFDQCIWLSLPFVQAFCTA